MKFLSFLLALSLGGSVLGLALMLLRAVAGKKLPAAWLYGAWLLVLLRFILPVGGLLPVGQGSGEEKAASPAAYEQNASPTVPYVPVPTPQREPLPPESAVPSTALVPMAPTITESPESPAATRPAALHARLSALLTALWAAGALAAFGCTLVPYLRLSRRLRRSLRPPARTEITVYDQLRQGNAQGPRLARSPFVPAPLTFGLFRPVLVLPDTPCEPAALAMILSHELVHYRRHDIAGKWFTTAVLSLHWFNPLVYLFRREMDRLCELSCDERLLRDMSRPLRREYGEALLAMAERSAAPELPVATGFSGDKKNLKERLVQIMQFKKKGRLAIAAAALCVLLLAGCGLALGPKTEQEPAAEPPAPVMAQGAEQGSVVTVSTVDELLAALGSDTEIHLQPGVYNLTESSLYGKPVGNDEVYWGEYGFPGEYELRLQQVTGLTLEGDNAEIVTEPRCANVLQLELCNNVTLRGVTLGHTEAAEACEGAVLHLMNCSGITVDSCGLYGCGTIGIWADNFRGITVTDTDIYHCSSGGVQFYDGRGVTMTDCRIYDCGNDSEYGAVAPFIFYSVQDFSAAGCEVYDSHFSNLLYSCSNSVAAFSGLTVRDNHFDTLFYAEDTAEFTDLALSGNVIDAWYANGSAPALEDGEPLDASGLTDRWGEQLSSAGLGAVEAEFREPVTDGAEEIHVKTVDQFLAALGSDRLIVIDIPRLNLTEASDYGEGTPAEDYYPELDFSEKPYTWRWTYDGWALCIGCVENLHIRGGEIITEPRYADVLSFYSCGNVSLQGVTLGHSPEPGSCAGGVLYLNNSSGITLEGCDLYGCGILGITADYSSDLAVQRTRIHDCSCGAARFNDCELVTFLECTVENCPTPHFALQNCTGFSWDRTLMDPWASFDIPA